MTTVGFDLGSSTLKIIECMNEGKKKRLTKAIEFAHPFGTMLPGDHDQMQQLSSMIKTMLADKKVDLSNVRAALPEDIVSTKIISTPQLTDAELASAIDWLAEQHIAIPLEELSIEYEVLYRPEKKTPNDMMRVMLIGVPKVAINRYMDFFAQLEIEPSIMETQVLSVLRTVLTADMPTTLVMNMGASNTDFFIIHDREIVFVYSFPNGGRLLTRSIERGLNVDPQQAEDYKKTYGVDPQFLEGKMVGILQPVVQLFITEIQKALQFFLGQFGTQTVKRILVCGGSAHLPGLLPYLASQLNVEATIAHPFAAFTYDTKIQVPMDREATFTVASGLAIREK